MTEDTILANNKPDELLNNRKLMLLPLCIVGVCCFAPFFVYDLIRGNFLLSFVLFVITVVFSVNGYAIYHYRRIWIPFEILLIPAAIAIVISVRYQGIFGTYWCYPCLLFFYFVLKRRKANFCAILLLVAVTYVVAITSGWDLTVRFSVSLSLLIVMANIIVWAIDDLHRRLLDQTIKDPLTGAFNRRHMNSLLSEAVSKKRRHDTPASILLVDIDFFKRINDELGHGIGDKVLIEVVALIVRRVRHTDKLFRIGGEEFLLYLPDTGEKEAAIVANHLCSLIAETDLLKDRQVTVSIGVSELEPEVTLDDWIKYTDELLYKAKRDGRNRYVCGSFLSNMTGLTA